MFTAYLKSGEIVQIPLEELEDFIYENLDLIQTRPIKLRRPRRGDVPSNDTVAITSSRRFPLV